MWRSLPSTSARAKVTNTEPLEPLPIQRFSPLSSHEPSGWRTARELEVVGVRPGLGLGQREPGQLASRREVGQEARLLLVAAEQRDALVADRLVHAEHHRERGVGLAEHLEDAAVAGLREALAAVLLWHVQAAAPALAELADDVVADPALLLDRARVDQLSAYSRSQPTSSRTLLLLSSGRG